MRVALVFARRGFNIESLVVSAAAQRRLLAHDDHLPRRPHDLEQIVKQLAKLVDVVHAIDHTGDQAYRDRDRAGQAPVPTSKAARRSSRSPSTSARKVVDYGQDSLMLRVYGSSEKLDAFIELLRPLRPHRAGALAARS